MIMFKYFETSHSTFSHGWVDNIYAVENSIEKDITYEMYAKKTSLKDIHIKE